MFRSDRDALANKVDDLQAENERLRRQNEAMRSDLLAQRTGAAAAAPNVYRANVEEISPGERVALSRHQLTAFPVWAAVILHLITFGLASFIRFNLMHGKLPKAERDDPSAGKGIGFHFIPYFNYYWVFWNGLRLADRINLQCRLRGIPLPVSRGLVISAGVASVVPYVQFITGPLVWLAVAIAMQRAVNAVVEADAEAARSAEEAREAAPPLRVPAVQDLPLPEDVAAQAEIEDAIEPPGQRMVR